ncbi:hypothetical protein [Cohnella nanjingensis]|uniref:Uncharacterized protein n=1 Tax=Cohnella nanjingensis TaxID=1387779 RepID=A0A7X0RSR2_9BACL|nr:hypothetical protein [Cohnella nanjingensis]MBB6672977.1 hypothetical protein [Cohnella nanjingensis]
MKGDSFAGTRDYRKYIIPLVFLHIAGASMLGSATDRFPALWGMGLIAYTLGSGNIQQWLGKIDMGRWGYGLVVLFAVAWLVGYAGWKKGDSRLLPRRIYRR